MKPYGLISDTHHHGWSAFSSVNKDGVNSRLQVLLDETKRCADELRKAGGEVIIHAGDMFHVRGSISPSVLNPTLDLYKSLIHEGFRIYITAGNHDLERKQAERVSSAVTALEGVGCKIINSTFYGASVINDVVLVPWIENLADLKKHLEGFSGDPGIKDVDLVLHAPIDGVIMGIPDHGLTADYLSKLGFKRVFAGHYHNFKDFGNGVYSIGALAHHTWSDIGSKAGFLIVSETEVKRFASHAPAFVEISSSTDLDEVYAIVDGNYVRARVSSSKVSDLEDMRKFLESNGAKGVVLMSQREASVESRSGSTIKSGASVETSVGEFIASKKYDRQADLTKLCLNILSEAQAGSV